MTAEIDETKYAQMLTQYKPRPIHTERDNERAIEALERLYADDALTPEQEALGEVLATLIEKFEEERYSLKSASPMEILRELLQAHGLQQKDLAKLIGSKGVASEILSGKRRISRSHAQLFASRFNVPYHVFL